MKKSLCLLLALLIVFPLLFVPMREAGAATKQTQLTTITSFKTTLSYKQYNALRTGTISVIKSNNVWYYKFSTKDYYVLVKPSAFSSGYNNNYSALNKNLSAGLNSDYSKTPGYVYKCQSSMKDYNNSHFSSKLYNTDLSYYSFYSSCDSSRVVLKCKRNGSVHFEYHEKVRKYSQRSDEFVTPSNKDQFARALSRSKKEYVAINPKFEIFVKQPGEKKIMLKSFKYQTEGRVKKQKYLDKIIKVTYTVGSIAWNTTSKGFSVKSLYDIYKLGIDLKDGSKFKLTDSEPLSKNENGKNYKITKTLFVSPTNLEKDGHYFEVDLNLNAKPTFTGKKKTIFSVSFSN